MISSSLVWLTVAGGVTVVTVDQTPRPTQQSRKAPSAHVGSAMPVLATLEQAQVLPPEGTKEATRIVQSVIQLQAAFTTGEDPTIRAFASRALFARAGAQAPALLETSRAAGWTA